MEKGYKKVYWGLIVAIFNFHIGPINILPDFLGYFLISSGLSIIQDEDKHDSFKISTIIAGALTFYSLMTSILVITGGVGFFNYKILNNNIMKIGSTLLISALNLVMDFNILSGTKSLLMNVEKSEAAELTDKIQRNYTYLYIIALLLISISFNISNEVFIISVTVYLIIIRLYFVSIIRRIRKYFDSENENQGSDTDLSNENIGHDAK